MPKTCFKCGVRKPLGAFYKHPQMRDGRLNKCMDCTKVDARRHRRESEPARIADRARYQQPHRRAMVNARAAKDRVDHPDRYRARYAIRNAVRDGRAFKGCCEVCGDTNVHAHHDDYTKPLEVRWLCPLHHMRHHHAIQD